MKLLVCHSCVALLKPFISREKKFGTLSSAFVSNVLYALDFEVLLGVT